MLRVSVGLKKVSGLLQITFVKGILHRVSDSSTQIAIAQKSTSQMLSLFLSAAKEVSLQKCRRGLSYLEKKSWILVNTFLKKSYEELSKILLSI